MSHSLGALAWLPPPPSKLVKRAAASSPAGAAAVAARRAVVDLPPSVWDYADDLADSDGEDDDSKMDLLMGRMQEGLDFGLQERRAARTAATATAVVAFFRGIRTEERALRSYDIDVYVRAVRVPGLAGDGRIRRRLRVPASTPLHALADRVLIPALGYARGCHGYMYTLPTAAYAGRRRPTIKEDVGFWPQGAGTVDITCHLHSNRGGYCPIAAQQVLLCDLLREEGDTLKWKYDLGDALVHLITLVKVHPVGILQDAEGRSALVLEGAGAGIPENPGSQHAHAKRLVEIALGGSSARAAMKEMMESAPNWASVARPDGKTYDPTYFSLAACQKALDAAAVEPGGADFGGAFNVVIPFGNHSAADASRAHLDMMRTRVVCATCDKVLKDPSWCANCRNAAYCSRDCQRRDWPAHKLACIASSS